MTSAFSFRREIWVTDHVVGPLGRLVESIGPISNISTKAFALQVSASDAPMR